MEPYKELCESFMAINERKRWNPAAMSSSDWEQWKRQCQKLERALFNEGLPPGPQTRGSLRLPVTLEVRYAAKGGERQRYLQTIGDGGAFIASIDPQPVQTQLDLELPTPGGQQRSRVKTEVIWVRQSEDPAKRGMGVRYVDLSDEQRRVVYRIVDDNLTRHLAHMRPSQDDRPEVRLVYEYRFAEGKLGLRRITPGQARDLFVSTAHPLGEGERVRLVLYVPGPAPALRAIGEVSEVVRAPSPGQSPGFGVRILEMNSEDLEALRAYQERGEEVPDDPASVAWHRPRFEPPERRIRLRFCGERESAILYSDDLRQKGAFFPAVVKMPRGSRVHIFLVHPVHLRSLLVSGVVAGPRLSSDPGHERVAGTKMLFADIEEDALERLQRFLRDFAVPLEPAHDPGSAGSTGEKKAGRRFRFGRW